MKHPTIPPRVRPVESLRRQFAQATGLPFADVLSATQIEQVLVDCQVQFRERIFSPLITVATFLSQVLDPDHSMRQAVARLIAYRASLGLPACAPGNRAYSKARQRLPEDVWAQLTRRTGRDLLIEAPARWCWRGRDVKVVDGSTLSMPDTPANQQAYPQVASQKPGLGFPVLRIVALFSLAVGTVLDVAMGPWKGKHTGETSLFRTLHHHLDEGDVLLADRYFCGYCHLALVHERGADVVMRLHHLRRYDFRRGQRLGRDDHIVTWSKPKKRPDGLDEAAFRRLPDTLTMRELRIRVPGKNCRSRTILVATTLLDRHAYPKNSIAALYRQRWHAELDLRSLKTILQMDVLRCLSPAMVRKEIWVHLLAYNLIRKVMAQAAQEHQLLPRQISFKGTLQTLNAFSDRLRTCTPKDLETLCRVLLAAVAKHRVGNRPGRLEPRAKKRRPKPYRLLNRPRDQARKVEIIAT
ncbi:MAG TPA: IS4 family transposase [Pseudoxanthomonas sp.]|nr:IS4 family transposase [Pseudoxanthomonas sp.]